MQWTRFLENTKNIYEIKMTLRNLFEKYFDQRVDIATKKYLKPRIKEQILREAIYV